MVSTLYQKCLLQSRWSHHCWLRLIPLPGRGRQHLTPGTKTPECNSADCQFATLCAQLRAMRRAELSVLTSAISHGGQLAGLISFPMPPSIQFLHSLFCKTVRTRPWQPCRWRDTRLALAPLMGSSSPAPGSRQHSPWWWLTISWLVVSNFSPPVPTVDSLLPGSG